MECGFRATGEEVILLLCAELILVFLKPLVLLLQLFHCLLGERATRSQGDREESEEQRHTKVQLKVQGAEMKETTNQSWFIFMGGSKFEMRSHRTRKQGQSKHVEQQQAAKLERVASL